MAVYKSKVSNALRVGFKVKQDGLLLTGQAANLTIEILDPTLGVSSGTLTVTESTAKSGIYWVSIPSSFFTTNGVGNYLVVIEISKTTEPPLIDVNTYTLEVTQNDLDDISSDVELVKKVLINRLELADGSTNNWILYDNDDTAPLLTFSVTDKDGLSVVQAASVPSRRTRGT